MRLSVCLSDSVYVCLRVCVSVRLYGVRKISRKLTNALLYVDQTWESGGLLEGIKVVADPVPGSVFRFLANRLSI